MNKQQAGNRTYEETIQTIQDIQKQQSLTYTQAVEEKEIKFFVQRIIRFAREQIEMGRNYGWTEDTLAQELRSFASSIRQSVIEEIEGKMPKESQKIPTQSLSRYGQGFNQALSELHTLLEAMKKEAV